MALTEEILTGVKRKNKQIKRKLDKLGSLDCSAAKFNPENIDICDLEKIRERVRAKRTHVNTP